MRGQRGLRSFPADSSRCNSLKTSQFSRIPVSCDDLCFQVGENVLQGPAVLCI